MSQFNPMYTSGTNIGMPYVTNETVTRRLFVETGFGYKEVASSKGGAGVNKHFAFASDGVTCIARIVEDYVPPTPSFKTAEMKIAGAPSIIHGTGKSSYKIALRLIFPDKLSYNDFMFYSANAFKFYDEKGSVFLGVVGESMEVKRAEGGAIYDVKFSLTANRKSIDDSIEEIRFTDIYQGFGLITITVTQGSEFGGTIGFSYPHKSITGSATIPAYSSEETAVDLLVSSMINSGIGYYFTLEKSGRYIVLKPKDRGYMDDAEPIIFTTSPISLSTTAVKTTGEHWSRKLVESASHAGLVTMLDGRGNYIYYFRPDDKAKRSEATVFINRLRKYLERMIRG